MTLADHFKADLLKKGIEQGIEKGWKERDIEAQKEKIGMAKTLLLKGIDIEIISETTGLSSEEIKKFYS
jgi:predicted transposase/invertase (TIGR01784 family)